MSSQLAASRPDSPGSNPEAGTGARQPLVSVVLPCLDEEEGIGECIDTIRETLEREGIDGEIIVCDNGSTDRSVEIAEAHGARVVHQPLRGYGHAYQMGFASARGAYLVMGDADATYDFRLIPQFLRRLAEGYDFVTGSRYITNGYRGPLLHRVFGNPALTALLNLLFGSRWTDVYCGFRAFSRRAWERIQPVSPGMEFNLELAINASLAGLSATEIPIELAPRKGESKLRTLRDGWRSLRMMLLYCPNKVFLLPGLLLFAAGLLTHLVLLLGLLTWGGREAGAVTGLFALTATVVGFSILDLGLHAKTYSWSRRFDADNPALRRFYRRFTLETGLVTGAGLLVLGAAILLFEVVRWFQGDLNPLPHPERATFGATLVILGFNVVFSSLFISAMSMKR